MSDVRLFPAEIPPGSPAAQLRRVLFERQERALAAPVGEPGPASVPRSVDARARYAAAAARA